MQRHHSFKTTTIPCSASIVAECLKLLATPLNFELYYANDTRYTKENFSHHPEKKAMIIKGETHFNLFMKMCFLLFLFGALILSDKTKDREGEGHFSQLFQLFSFLLLVLLLKHSSLFHLWRAVLECGRWSTDSLNHQLWLLLSTDKTVLKTMWNRFETSWNGMERNSTNFL